MPYTKLDASQIVLTADRLKERIEARFPGRGLVRVCTEVCAVAGRAGAEAERLGKPVVWLQGAVWTVLALAAGAVVWALSHVKTSIGAAGMLDWLAGLDAAANLSVLTFAAVFSLLALEGRIKRARALRALHGLRSLVHVVDMHQLTKDPAMLGATLTPASPDHAMSGFELSRYLDYCSEMVTLTAKIAALYAQNVGDGAVIDAASDIEQLATNLAQKIWQKIAIVQSMAPASRLS